MIGDRLDTDISGANAAGLPSLLVLTGVSTAADMVHADAAERPNYLAHGPALAARRRRAACASRPHPAWRVEIGAGRRDGALDR